MSVLYTHIEVLEKLGQSLLFPLEGTGTPPEMVLSARYVCIKADITTNTSKEVTEQIAV